MNDDEFGPNTSAVRALIERVGALTADEAKALNAAWFDAWDTAWYDAWDAASAACDAARDAANAAWDAARDAARNAARDAVVALVVRDLITAEHFEVLTRPWREAVGPELVMQTGEGK